MPDELAPEDRERLVRVKFGELFDEFWEAKFGEAFDKRVLEMGTATGKAPTAPQHAPNGTQAQPQSHKRRSLLEIALSDALGIK